MQSSGRSYARSVPEGSERHQGAPLQRGPRSPLPPGHGPAAVVLLLGGQMVERTFQLLVGEPAAGQRAGCAGEVVRVVALARCVARRHRVLPAAGGVEHREPLIAHQATEPGRRRRRAGPVRCAVQEGDRGLRPRRRSGLLQGLDRRSSTKSVARQQPGVPDAGWRLVSHVRRWPAREQLLRAEAYRRSGDARARRDSRAEWAGAARQSAVSGATRRPDSGSTRSTGCPSGSGRPRRRTLEGRAGGVQRLRRAPRRSRSST
ncbi:hypothetical protein SCALM49S_10187 [Streptomyces californicus]